MEPIGLVREEGTGPSRWEQTGPQMPQEEWAPTPARETVFDHDNESGTTLIWDFQAEAKTPFCTSLLKVAFWKLLLFLLLLRGKRANEETFQCPLYPMTLWLPWFPSQDTVIQMFKEPPPLELTTITHANKFCQHLIMRAMSPPCLIGGHKEVIGTMVSGLRSHFSGSGHADTTSRSRPL